VSPGDATAGRLDLSRCTRFVGQGDFDDLTDGPRRPRRGDIIYTRNASIGIASYVDTDEPFTMGQDVCLIRSEHQDQRFLSYVLNTFGRDQLDEQKIGSTFSRINVARVLDLSVPSPLIADQRRIADELDAATARVSDFIDATQRQISLLAERRQALITAAVTGQLEIPGVAT
jgi:type I restriction enzyme S subunit